MSQLRAGLAGASFVVLCLLAIRLFVLPGIGRFLVVSDPLPMRADAIVVLAGAPDERLADAAHLFGRGLAPLVVLTRERRPTGAIALDRSGVRLPETHDLSWDALRALGVPDDRIVTLRRRASSTSSEALVIARHACRHGLRRLIVVTSPSHTRRSRLILRRALPADADLSLRPASAAYFPASRWWRRRHVAKHVLFEYQKLLNFWLRERWAIEPCRMR